MSFVLSLLARGLTLLSVGIKAGEKAAWWESDFLAHRPESYGANFTIASPIDDPIR